MLNALANRFRSSLSQGAMTLCLSALFAATNAQAQTVSSSPASLNFGSVAAQSTSGVQTLTFTFTAAGTLGSYQVLTQGIANQDFTAAPTSTCQSQPYAKNATCTVDVTFAPKYPGLRSGAVVLFNSSGAAIQTSYVQGLGTGPQVAFLPGTPTVIVNTALYQPKNMVLDAAGDIFVANAARCQILKFAPPSYALAATISTLLSGSCFSPTNGGEPRGVAVDGAGNVYAITSDTGTVLKASLKSDGSYSAPGAILTGTALDTPSGIAVDGSGNLFITDSFTRLTGSHNRVLMAAVQAGGPYTVSTIASTGTTNTQPWGVAVDSSGNVYYSDIAQNVVVRLTNSSWTTTQVASGLLGPYGLTVDAAGDVYIADTDNATHNQVIEASPNAGGASYTKTVISNFTVTNVRGVGLDLQGNLSLVSGKVLCWD